MNKMKLFLTTCALVSLAACNTTATKDVGDAAAMAKAPQMAVLTTGDIIKRVTDIQIGNKSVTAIIHADGTTTGVVTGTGVAYISKWKLKNGQYCRTFIKGIIDPKEKCSTFKAVMNEDNKITAVTFIEAGKDDRSFATVKPA